MYVITKDYRVLKQDAPEGPLGCLRAESHLTKSDTSETFRVAEMGGPESVQTIDFKPTLHNFNGN